MKKLFLVFIFGIAILSCKKESACIDPNSIDRTIVCTYEYSPVCGCNGVSYGNSCEATAAGVTSYDQGSCSD